MLAAILIIIAASVSFSVVTLLILFYIGKCPDAEQTQDDDSRYYDENGNWVPAGETDPTDPTDPEGSEEVSPERGTDFLNWLLNTAA